MLCGLVVYSRSARFSACQLESVFCEVSAKLASWPTWQRVSLAVVGEGNLPQPVKQPVTLREKVHFHFCARCHSCYSFVVFIYLSRNCGFKKFKVKFHLCMMAETFSAKKKESLLHFPGHSELGYPWDTYYRWAAYELD